MEVFAEMVSKKTEGRVTYTIYDSSSFGDYNDILQMVKDGTLHMFYNGAGSFPGAFPVTNCMQLPFKYNEIATGQRMLYALYNAGYLTELENDDLHVSILCPTDMQRVAFVNKKVESVSDLKGMKIRAVSPTICSALERFGAIPVTIKVAETYLALETGVVDGVVSSPESMNNWKYQDVCKYLLNAPLHGAIILGLMNQDTYQSFPDNIKALYDEACKEFLVYQLDSMVQIEKNSMKMMAAAGMEIYEASESFIDEMKTLCAGADEEYVADITAQGYDGKVILELINKTIKECEG
jgi:TRAP-type C4-dicarboxylate transport system substrate-binding protein